jgi:hypothetical protein
MNPVEPLEVLSCSSPKSRNSRPFLGITSPQSFADMDLELRSILSGVLSKYSKPIADADSNVVGFMNVETVLAREC